MTLQFATWGAISAAFCTIKRRPFPRTKAATPDAAWHERCVPTSSERIVLMSDLVFVLATSVFFAVTAVYVRACETL